MAAIKAKHPGAWATGFSVYRRDARSAQPPRRTAGPFPFWRDAFLARCALARAALRADAISPAHFSIRVDPLTAAR